ncbi:3-methyl-2-oxobutanoate hydroxymethyltransferase [bacterium]|nr:3-methyl-2-oxobutanoate hydroxymethyltransferase [bacterium]
MTTKKDIHYLQTLKHNNTPISMLTCYDALFAELMNKADIDCLLVGDSVGTNVLGYASEQEVTLTDMLHHTAAVARKTTTSFIIADLPYNTYTTPEQGLKSAQKLVEAGADAIKFEGYFPELCTHLVQHNILPVCHLGLLPQTAIKKTMQAKTEDEQNTLIKQAQSLEAAGAKLLIIELMPSHVAKRVTTTLTIPVIGIAAGPDCDGQVQVVNDILGLHEKTFKHVTRFASLRDDITSIFSTYHQHLKAGHLIQ